jgi:hypothetical protein
VRNSSNYIENLISCAAFRILVCVMCELLTISTLGDSCHMLGKLNGGMVQMGARDNCGHCRRISAKYGNRRVRAERVLQRAGSFFPASLLFPFLPPSPSSPTPLLHTTVPHSVPFRSHQARAVVVREYHIQPVSTPVVGLSGTFSTEGPSRRLRKGTTS